MNTKNSYTLAIEALSRATDGHDGGAYVPVSANTLRELSAFLKNGALIEKLTAAFHENTTALRDVLQGTVPIRSRGKRGRPADVNLKAETKWIAMEYYTLRVKDGLEPDDAVAVIQKRRSDGLLFTHNARPERNK